MDRDKKTPQQIVQEIFHNLGAIVNSATNSVDGLSKSGVVIDKIKIKSDSLRTQSRLMARQMQLKNMSLIRYRFELFKEWFSSSIVPWIDFCFVCDDEFE